jgi:hypothetical protein
MPTNVPPDPTPPDYKKAEHKVDAAVEALRVPVTAARQTRDRKTVIDQSPWRAQIEALLIRGYSPRDVNFMLQNLYPDYQPINEETMRRYRHTRLKDRVRKFYVRPEDEDYGVTPPNPLAGLVALVELQAERVTRGVEMEKALGGRRAWVGHEIQRAAELWVKLSEMMERFGYLPRTRGPAALVLAGAGANVNIFDVLQQKIDALPEDLRQQMAEAVTQIREARLRAQVEAAEKEMAEMVLPAETVNGDA